MQPHEGQPHEGQAPEGQAHEGQAHEGQPHQVLGVRPGASRAEVAEAFRRFALRHHPDRGGDPSRFHEGVEAYRRLTGSRPAAADVVFHRRSRPGIPSLLRLARRRLAAVRSRT